MALLGRSTACYRFLHDNRLLTAVPDRCLTERSQVAVPVAYSVTVPDFPSSAALQALFANTRAALLAERGEQGHWEGELSASALSTATAVIALDLLRRSDIAGDVARIPPLIVGGLRWLAEHQNPDGGWGDTVKSHSNISTTALVWAAFAQSDGFQAAISRCEAWLTRATGSLEPRSLSKAIAARYGKDKTFSVPILTALALRGRLGPDARAWQLVPQLPFELAAFPATWYAALRWPVVSYALPALIAIGQLRHSRRPTRNPILRVIRNWTRQTTLRVLHSIQPESGGFLEATPLTSFVAMSLIGAGNTDHPVVRQGVEFLQRSVRLDSSWPIDTNLATWVTTLSVNALAAADALPEAAECDVIRDWIAGQQYQQVHRYTNAAPGAWAWTNLTGGVPDADDTPGALLALWHLAGPSAAPQAAQGVKWLLDLQNSDGGIPTFCRGWGVLPFDRSSADLTAHALRAWDIWRPHLPAGLQRRIAAATRKALAFLARQQRTDGAWAPLWFGNQDAPSEENLTYGTSRVLLALATIRTESAHPLSLGLSPKRARGQTREPNASAAIDWLRFAQNVDGGWGGVVATPPSIEETALAVEALCAASTFLSPSPADELLACISRGLSWLIEATNNGRCCPPSPIGFYFAKLWYYEKLYPMIYTLAAAGRALKLEPWRTTRREPIGVPGA
jgi:squalene-hopene/tetraprenyl-beta-curcumene cyclase